MPKSDKKPAMRFEATLHARGRKAAEKLAADLDLDRIPDPSGAVRVLVEADEVAEVLERGGQLKLEKAHPVRPLDPQLVMSDDAARAWLEEQTRGLERKGGQ